MQGSWPMQHVLYIWGDSCLGWALMITLTTLARNPPSKQASRSCWRDATLVDVSRAFSTSLNGIRPPFALAPVRQWSCMARARAHLPRCQVRLCLLVRCRLALPGRLVPSAGQPIPSSSVCLRAATIWTVLHHQCLCTPSPAPARQEGSLPR